MNKPIRFVFFIFVMALNGFHPAHGSGLKFEKPTAYPGEVFRGEKVNVRFPIYNPTSKVIQILGVHVDCGCLLVKDSVTSLLPHQKTFLDIVLDTSEFVGEIDKKIIVVYQSSRKRSRTLKIKLKVLEEFSVDPPVLVFSPFKKHLSVRLTSQKSIKISEVDFNQQHFKVQLGPDGKNISVTPLPRFWQSTGSHYLQLFNNSTYHPVFSLPVMRINKDAVKIEEIPVDLGVIDPGDQIAKELVLGRGSADLMTSSIVYVADRRLSKDQHLLNVSVHDTEKEGLKLRLQIRNDGTEFGFLRGKVQLSSEDGRILYAFNAMGYLEK